MKKALKIIGVLVLAIILILTIAALYIQIQGIPEYPTAKLEYTSVSTEASLERGEKLVTVLCAGCHTNPERGNLSGTAMKDVPSEFGMVYAPNITQDMTHGIGSWSDADILYLLRTGIKRNGQYSPPYMAKLPLMADADINAIISFLKSDDQRVVADSAPDKSSEPSFLTKLLCRVAWKPFPMPTAEIALPDTLNKLELGEYLAHNLDCFSCHSADYKTNNFLDPTKSVGYFGGGNKPLNREGKIILTSNLTPHETGIGNLSEEQFIQAVRYGMKEGEPSLVYPMMPYSVLTDYEVSAIYEYLLTIPPIDNLVERSVE